VSALKGIDRAKLIEDISSLLINNKLDEKPLIVGINGMDTSGKTRLAMDLEHELKKREIPVQTVHVDDFHNPKSIRYNKDLPDYLQYYCLSINFPKLIQEVLQPISEGKLRKELILLDLELDEWSMLRRYEVDVSTIVIVEGVFLFREELQSFFDVSILLEVEEEEIIKRAWQRDVPNQGNEVIEKYFRKYLPAQRMYIHKCNPEKFASIVIENTDWKNPKLKKWHS